MADSDHSGTVRDGQTGILKECNDMSLREHFPALRFLIRHSEANVNHDE